ncbi:MAG: hypothetical protein AAF688_15465 [Bacteroidota bacterium]
MKRLLCISVLALLLFNSCIVKSIQPFYTTKSLKFDKIVIGNWEDNKKRQWEFKSFKEEWKKENEDPTKLMKEDLEAYERYKEGYLVKYTRRSNEALFIGMPFKIDNHLFIDFTPFQYESDDLNPLIAQHLLKTHSVAFVGIDNQKNITLKWLSEKAMNHLINNDKLRLKHERTGIDEDLILTATSEELSSFLKKFISSDGDYKWDNDDTFTLKAINAKP